MGINAFIQRPAKSQVDANTNSYTVNAFCHLVVRISASKSLVQDAEYVFMHACSFHDIIIYKCFN